MLGSERMHSGDWKNNAGTYVLIDGFTRTWIAVTLICIYNRFIFFYSLKKYCLVLIPTWQISNCYSSIYGVCEYQIERSTVFFFDAPKTRNIIKQPFRKHGRYVEAYKKVVAGKLRFAPCPPADNRTRLKITGALWMGPFRIINRVFNLHYLRKRTPEGDFNTKFCVKLCRLLSTISCILFYFTTKKAYRITKKGQWQAKILYVWIIEVCFNHAAILFA